MELSDYLKQEYLQYCVQVGGVIPETEWVSQVLNAELPPGDKLAYPSVNQWMKGTRGPDAKNIVRLIQVFGPEVIPYVGISLPGDLALLVRDWDKLDEDTKQKILEIAHIDEGPGRETIQAQ